MTSGYTEVFGGGTIFPSSASYLALSLDADVTLEWPLEASNSAYVVANIIDVDPSGSGFSITMPSALQGSTGNATQFSNVGADTYTVLDADGNTLLSVDAGETWTIYLTDNSTIAGTWRSYVNGAGTTPASAAALAGYGLTAIGSTLAQSQPPTITNMSGYALGAPDRASLFIWDGGVGTISVPSTTTAGTNYFASFNNAGSGNWTIETPDSALIDGAATKVLRPGDSVELTLASGNWYSVGAGQEAVFAFDYTSIDLTGLSGSYVLSGSELNRIAYKFIGVLTGNIEITVPSTTQQYWVDNATSGGSYTLAVGTATQVPFLTVVRGARGIYYSNGSTVVNADTAAIATPISISDGGTGSGTAGGALINLGGTATGIAVFTAASATAGRTALSAASSGANSDITSLTGLTTPLGVAYGGTGLATTPTNGKLLIGNGTNYTLSTLTQGNGIVVTNGAGSVTLAVSFAVDTDIWTGTSAVKSVTPDSIFDAAVFQTLVSGSTVTPDFGTGLNFSLTAGTNVTIDNPTSPKEGQSGVILFIQDGTGNRTVTFGSDWRFPGSAPVATPTAGAIDAIAYLVMTGGVVLATYINNFTT